jgi:hypothetical protein
MIRRNTSTPLLPLTLLMGILVPAPAAMAELPVHGPAILLCRANFNGAYNLPNSAFFTNSTPALNEMGETAIHLSVLGNDTRGVFYHDGVVGGVAYEGPVGAFLSDVSINNLGRVVFPMSQSSNQDGIWRWDAPTDTSGRLTNLPLGTSTWGSPQVDDQNRVGYRAGFPGGQAFASWDNGAVAIHATENGIDSGSPYSFLFTPSANSQRQIAGKVRLGAAGQIDEARPDQIRIWSSDGSSVLIAEDVNSNVGSPYARFDNSVSLTDNGWVAFTALGTDNRRGVYFSNGTTTRQIAIDDNTTVTDIEFFAPAANNAGQVVFRGRNNAGLQTIFVGDGTTLAAVIGEHDLVDTDLGQGRLDQHDNSPIFGGGPAINQLGDVAFGAGLTPPGDNQVEWGSGVFVMRADSSIFADGFESGDTTAWTQTVP